jgi:hypothetical protein
MTPRDQANAFIVALEAELPGLACRSSRLLLGTQAISWAETDGRGTALPEPMRAGLLRLAKALGFSGNRNAVERAIERAESRRDEMVREDGGRL